ncbi:MAG: HEAT repeat domain-containing protein [bacterium]
MMMKSGRWIMVGSLVSILMMGGLGLAMGKKPAKSEEPAEVERLQADVQTNTEVVEGKVEQVKSEMDETKEEEHSAQDQSGYPDWWKKEIKAIVIPRPDTPTTVLEKKRVEIFKEMGWKEGEYENEKEELQTKRCFHPSFLNKADTLLLPDAGRLGDTTTIRPLTEYIFNEKVQEDGRRAAVEALGQIGRRTGSNKKVASILKRLLEDESQKMRFCVMRALYDLEEKDNAFEEMDKLAREGHHAVFIPTEDRKAYFDPDAKPTLLKIINYKNDVARIMAAYYLVMIGEKATAEKIALEYKAMDLKEIDYSEPNAKLTENDTIMSYVKRILAQIRKEEK